MANEVGANPIEALEGGELAEALAESMAGLADMFEFLMEDAETVANRSEVESALRAYKEEHAQTLIDAQEHGMSLANNIQAGASETAVNDLESAEMYESLWDLAINF